MILKLNSNGKLLSMFPEDPHFDFTIEFNNKSYKLQRAYLRLETDFFEGRAKVFNMKNNFPPLVFENILKCLYGGEYHIIK